MAVLSEASELIPQGDLNLPSCIEYAVASAARHTKCAAARIAVDSSKDMAIEGVGNIQFEDEALAFGDASALYDRKVLVDVAGTSDIAERHREVSEDIALLGNQARGRVRVQESRAIEEIV